MNKLLIATAISSLFATSAFAGDWNPSATAGGFGNVNVNNSINGSVTAVNGGFSESQATNSQAANSSITATVGNSSKDFNQTTTAGVNSTVGTQSTSTAWNYSKGNAQGDANSQGGAGAVAGGSSAIPELAKGDGYAGVGHTDVLNADTNQGGWTSSVTSANFGSTQTVTSDFSFTGNGSDKNLQSGTAAVSVSSVLTGDSTVSNASGNMVLNASSSNPVALSTPENSFVGDSGTFNATGTAATGTAVGTVVGIGE